jgi:hypothetical protein
LNVFGARGLNRERDIEDAMRRARRMVDEIDDEELDLHGGFRAPPIFGNQNFDLLGDNGIIQQIL